MTIHTIRWVNQGSSTPSWLRDVRGEQLHPLIVSDEPLIRVEAGPGTGKTFGLTRRVERVVHPDGLGADPSRVLVVAFNRVIARDLRDDISKRLQRLRLDSSPTVQTIHSLCLEVLGEQHSRMVLPHETEAMVADILWRYPALRRTYGSTRSALQALRNHEAGHETHLTLWQAAEQWLREHSASMVGDLPRKLLGALEKGAFEELQYDHIVVDEFQDLSQAEHNLVTRLRSPDAGLVAVGDSRQSIYLFRGNDRLGLKKLEQISGERVADVHLTECIRCPPQIVNAANQLMSLEPTPRLVSASDESANVHLVAWKTPEAEAKGMARAIAANFDATPVEDRHLVMVSRRRFGYMLREQLAALRPDLAVHLGFSESIIELWPVREAFMFFSLLADPDPCSWRAWLGYRNSPPAPDSRADSFNADAYRKFMLSTQGEITSADVLALAGEEMDSRRGRGGKNLWGRAMRYGDLVSKVDWEDLSPEALISTVFEPSLWLGDKSGEDAEMASHDLRLLADRAMSTLALLEDPADPTKRQPNLKRVVDDLRYAIAVREPLTEPDRRAITVTTFWGAKGLTAEHVYMVGACDEAIPGERTDDYPGSPGEHFEEQRRLFYVSLTRTRRTMIISWPRKARWGELKRLRLKSPKSRLNSKYWAQLSPSVFLRDIEEELPARTTQGQDWQWPSTLTKQSG